jgi:ABC-type multidrug transport system fused ATPase/permease subunit
MVASTYPILDLFWTMAMFFLLFFWIFILIQIIIDIFRSHDMGGFAKALWLIGILIFPLLGVLIYLIARGGKMHERQIQSMQAQQKSMDQYIKQTASSGSAADEIAKLADLKSKGVISDAEFESQKAKLLS